MIKTWGDVSYFCERLKILIISILMARFKILRTFTYSSKYSKGFCGRERKPKSKLKNQII